MPKMRTFPVSLVIFLIFGFSPGDNARILGIFNVPSISHQIVYRRLMLALNERGHELVVLTPHPVNDPSLTNYTEIDLSIVKGNSLNINFIDLKKTGSHLQAIMTLYEQLYRKTEAVFQHPEFRKIYSRRSEEKFDLLIVETVAGHAYYAFAAWFNVPVIGISSLPILCTDRYATGDPMLPSHPANSLIGHDSGYQLSFWKRLNNFIGTWRFIYHLQTQMVPRQHQIAQKYLGSDIPYVGDIQKNTSLLFVNQQALLWHPIPKVPKVIEFSGFHLLKEAQPLPKEMQKFLDDATEGFVYMSLGSNVKSVTLPAETLKDFMAVFAKLPQRVLWKFENDSMPGKPDNVYIAKWVPQQGVLAHRNIKAFIYQGGAQSTEEAVHHAVPLLGFPVYSDQCSQVRSMVSHGVARSLEIIDLRRENLEKALHDVINNKGYKEKMLQLRTLLNDRPYDLLENAVWWTEFVIRHKGAPHLNSRIADEPWYRRYDEDIVAFISITAFATAILSLVVFYRIISCSFSLISSLVAGRKLKRC